MTTTPLASAIVFDPLLPLPLVIGVGVVLAAATVAAYFHIGTRVSRMQNSVLTVFRLLGLVGVLLLLLQPSRMEEIPPPDIRRVTVVAVDASKSMAQNDTDAGTRAESARTLLVDAGLLSAGGAPASRTVQLFQFGGNRRNFRNFVDELERCADRLVLKKRNGRAEIPFHCGRELDHN